MPIIEVTVTEGRERQKIRNLISEITDAAVRALDVPKANVRVLVRELGPDNFAAGDVTITERRKNAES